MLTASHRQQQQVLRTRRSVQTTYGSLVGNTSRQHVDNGVVYFSWAGGPFAGCDARNNSAITARTYNHNDGSTISSEHIAGGKTGFDDSTFDHPNGRMCGSHHPMTTQTNTGLIQRHHRADPYPMRVRIRRSLLAAATSMIAASCLSVGGDDPQSDVAYLFYLPESHIGDQLTISAADATALDIDQQTFPVTAGHDKGLAVISTGRLVSFGSDEETHCFVEPVTVVDNTGQAYRVADAGTCMEIVSSIDLRDTELQPAP